LNFSIVMLHPAASTPFWLWGITLLLVYFCTLSIMSDPTDKATLTSLGKKTWSPVDT
jgi:hypothetical protein